MKNFDISHIRVKKARLRGSLGKSSVRNLLWAIALTSIIAAAVGVTHIHLPVLTLLLVVAGPIIMLLGWYYGELAKLPPAANLASTDRIEEVLEPDLLALLDKKPSPKSIANAVSQTVGGRFYTNRYLIALSFLFDKLTDDPKDSGQIWETARGLSVDRNRVYLESTAVAAACILSIPGIDSLIASLNLDRDDITSGYDWYIHLIQISDSVKSKQAAGGVGHNLTFGWTPILDQIGHNLSDEVKRNGLLRRQIDAHEQVLVSMINLLSSATHQNVALVGEVGAGKTTLVYGLAERLQIEKSVPANLRYRQVIALDASTLISNAHGRGEIEQIMIRILNEAIKSKNTILFLDDANLFLEDSTGSVDLSNILLPALSGGAVRLIMAMNEGWWQRISQTNPSLTQLLNRVSVKPLNKKETILVAEDQILLFEWQHHLLYTYQALQAAYDLASRFVPDQVFPGRAMTVLEAAGNTSVNGLVTASSVEQAVEQRFGVRIQTVNQQSERDTLLHLEDKIHQRMINQTRAVGVVSDSLRRARAGVRNTKRPIGTFLFLGPTGVGKTELAKSLAAVYFGGEDRLVRIDMNEFSDARDTSRLLENAAVNPQSLCAQISKQPFSVVLLDEIEKAHDTVLNLLLQMLDEGILRDVNNREVNFRESIIIATSNAGADQIRAHIDQGQKLEDFEEPLINDLIASHIFKPEFINRFDEIVLFRPLDQAELVQVVDLNLIQINRSLANQKVSVELSPEAKQWLAQTGYDPRLGARPLRRLIQRTVENVVAQHVLNGQAIPGSTLSLGLDELKNANNDKSSHV